MNSSITGAGSRQRYFQGESDKVRVAQGNFIHLIKN